MRTEPDNDCRCSGAYCPAAVVRVLADSGEVDAVERAVGELAGRMKAVKVNVDESPQVTARFQVRGIPTLLLLRDGREVARRVGALPADQLLAWAQQTA
ncbi:MAG: thioredoxin family protein [Actinomycetota bacterium]|nr:thioredoxin family protein [Actinomycetota bacterium]